MVTVLEMTTNLCIPQAKKRGKPVKQKNNTNNKPPHQKNQTETKQNNQKPGDPNEGETVKQIWPSVSEDPGSQDICGGLHGRGAGRMGVAARIWEGWNVVNLTAIEDFSV